MNRIFSNLFTKSRSLLGAQNVRYSSKLDNKTHRVNNLEKKFLVWTGKYKSVEEVPAYVEQNVVERARNRMRIRIANYMMAVTAVACLGMIYVGKQAAHRGESVSQQNLEWHRQFNEDAKQKAEN